MAQRFTLGKNERLKRRKIIEQLFNKGKNINVFPFRVHYMPGYNTSGPVQAGFTVSSRHFKKAVDRNRIKRLMREAWRLQKNSLQEKLSTAHKQLVVFLVYTGKDILPWETANEKIAVILKKLTSIADEMVVTGS
jgi:ribonuclease P protein component